MKLGFWGKLGVFAAISLLFVGCADPAIETIRQPAPTAIDLGNAQYPISENEGQYEKIKEFLAPTLAPEKTPVATTPTSGVVNDYPKKPITSKVSLEEVEVVIGTNKGEITVSLGQNESPKSTENFLNKISNNFYQNLIFHRVEDWVIQGGDPWGNGKGGGQIATEISDKPFIAGSVGLARGADIEISNDSQFFICTQDCQFLNGQYTHLGQVTNGLEVVKNIAIGDKIEAIRVVK